MPKSKVFFNLLVAFIGGVAVASFILLPVAALAAIFILGGAGFAFGMLRVAERRTTALVGGVLMLFAAGSFWLFQAPHDPSSWVLSHAGERLTVRGIVASDPELKSRSQQFVFRRETSGERVLVTTGFHPAYRYGDILSLTGKLEAPSRFFADFDYPAHLAKDRIFAVMAFPETERLGTGGGSPLRGALFLIKAKFRASLGRVLPEPSAAFATGLLLGDRSSFPPDLTEALTRTGTTHLVALSGYNITIIGESLLQLFRAIRLPLAVALPAAASGIVLFVILAGAPASVVRAAVMGILVLAARREGRQYRMRNALALAAVVMLVENPLLLRFDTAFQLSFLATLGLVFVAPRFDAMLGSLAARVRVALVRRRLARPVVRSRSRGFFSRLRITFIETLAAQCAVLPLILYRFGRLSFISPLANLAVVPAIPLSMLAAFIAGAVGLVSDIAGRVAAVPATLLLGYDLSAIRWTSALPFAALDIPYVAPISLLVGYLLLGVWLFATRRRAAPRDRDPSLP